MFLCPCVTVLFSTLALHNFPGRTPVSFHVQTCSVNHYSPSCSSWLCNVCPHASLTAHYSNPAPNTELFISLGVLFGHGWQALANFILHVPLWGVGVAFACVIDDIWGREKSTLRVFTSSGFGHNVWAIVVPCSAAASQSPTVFRSMQDLGECGMYIEWWSGNLSSKWLV